MPIVTGDRAVALGSSATDTANAPQQPPAEARQVPDHPLIVIEPSGSWPTFQFRQFWEYRELLYFLTWRDLKVRYKQTALGVSWVVMQPILTTAIFTVFLGYLARVPSNGIPYPLFAYAGLLPWTFLMSAITSSSNSLVGSAHLITKVYFPRSIIAISAVAARLPDFAIAFVVLICMLLYYGVMPGWHILMLPVCICLLTLMALALGLASSALNVKYRDIGLMIPLLLQLWMFASPIVYSPSLVPPAWRRLYSLNPLVGIIDGSRTALLGGVFDWTAIAISAGITIGLLLIAVISFRIMEKHFADMV